MIPIHLKTPDHVLKEYWKATYLIAVQPTASGHYIETPTHTNTTLMYIYIYVCFTLHLCTGLCSLFFYKKKDDWHYKRLLHLGINLWKVERVELKFCRACIFWALYLINENVFISLPNSRIFWITVHDIFLSILKKIRANKYTDNQCDIKMSIIIEKKVHLPFNNTLPLRKDSGLCDQHIMENKGY